MYEDFLIFWMQEEFHLAQMNMKVVKAKSSRR
jgi:hypothetical protein